MLKNYAAYTNLSKIILMTQENTHIFQIKYYVSIIS